jgi:uncharacterized protein
MRKTLVAVALCALSLTSQAAPPTDASLDALFAASRADQMISLMLGSLEQGFRQGMAAAAAGKPLSAEQQRFLDAAPAKIVAVIKDEMSWDKLKPLMVQLYKESLTQEDVEGLTAFYNSAAGQAFVNKMPAVSQRATVLMQAYLQPMLPKMKLAMEQAIAEAKLGK